MSVANTWFRMYSEFASDPKVQSMSESMQRRLMMLFCLRCGNVLATLQDDELAFALRISEDELSETKALFLRKGFIDEDWSIKNWDKRQSLDYSRPSSEVWRVIRNRIFERDGFTCAYCGSTGGRLECDHIIPVAKGGTHEDSNLITACFACNRSKHAKTLAEWRASHGA